MFMQHIRNINNHQNESKTPEQKQKWNAYMKLYKKKGCEIKNPGFECENQMQSRTVGNLTIGCQSEICVLTVLCNARSNYLSHGEHTSSSVLTIARKDSVKTTLG